MTDFINSIFAEEITKGKKRRSIPNFDDSAVDYTYGIRLFLISSILVISLGILLTKLFSLTVIEGDKYRKLSVGNRIRETKILPPRGIIYDRNGKALVRNIPSFKLPDGKVYFENPPATISASAKESVARDYIYGEATAHLIGYVSEMGEEDLAGQKQFWGEYIGKMGIEEKYDKILRGRSGKELVEADAVGNSVRVLGNIAPIPGENLKLTIDADLQEIAKKELTEKKGAIIAQNPKTGEVLAYFSSPVFDPNRIIRGVDIESMLKDPQNPFFDRTISGLYPPGSTFKIVTSIAALESGAISKDTRIEDTGVLTVGQFSYGNWYFSQYGKKEGILDIVGALRRSNDIFFYKTGEATGIDALAKWAKKMGLGEKLGIDIEGEADGVMPDPSWRKRVRGENWYLGDTYHVAIGQGDLQATPLQVNAWTNIIASGGKFCRPYVAEVPSGECKDLGIKKETINLIKEGMKQACSPGGTGWPLFEFRVKRSVIPSDPELVEGESRDPVTNGSQFHGGGPSPTPDVGVGDDIRMDVACKTGTAEFGDPKNRTHAWFTVFVPVGNPQISITVLVEGGGEGSTDAAPIAKKILEKWFGGVN